MKKLLVTGLLVFTLVLTGCESKEEITPKEEIEDILSTIDDATSYTETLTAFGFTTVTKLDLENGLIQEAGGFGGETVTYEIIDGMVQYTEEECESNWGWFIDGVYDPSLDDVGMLEMNERYPDGNYDWDINEVCETILTPEPLESEDDDKLNFDDEEDLTFGKEEDGTLYLEFTSTEEMISGTVKVVFDTSDDKITLTMYVNGVSMMSVVYSDINSTDLSE